MKIPLFVLVILSSALAFPSSQQDVADYTSEWIDIVTSPFVGVLRNSNRLNCGVVILNSGLVLTSALCTETWLYPTNYRLRFGSSLVTSGGVDSAISNIPMRHPNFKSWVSKADYDLALLEVRFGLTFSDTIQSIRLPEEGEELPEEVTELELFNWGYNNEAAIYQLRRDRVKLISREECQIAHDNFVEYVTERTLCGFTVGRTSCETGGGALVYNNVVYGIASWGDLEQNCATTEKPAVYAKVSSMVDWIKETAEERGKPVE